jgi:hypothetical protein
MEYISHLGSASPARRQYWILGAGTFGRRAAIDLLKADPKALVTVVEQRQGIAPLPAPIRLITAEATGWLQRNLDPQAHRVDSILPCIPRHVLADWLTRSLPPNQRLVPTRIPQLALTLLPNPIAGPPGRLYVSQASSVCPDYCPEPADHCHKTGLPRKQPLYAEINSLSLPDFTIVLVRSHQLLPGLGGLRAQALLDAQQRIRSLCGGKVALATACRCHGVIDFRLLDAS